MSHATHGSKPKRRSKALPVLGAAGLSLSLASGASAVTGQPAAMLTRNTEVSHKITLREEDVSDVSLATFYVFDKENPGTFRRGVRFAVGAGGGCWTGTNYTTSGVGADANAPPHSIKPAYKYPHAPKRAHLPKNP